MGHLNRAVEASRLAIKQVVYAGIQRLFEPFHSLKPNDLNAAGRITDLCHDALPMACAYFFLETNPAYKLCMIHFVRDRGDGMNHGAVLVAERKILNQVTVGEHS